MGSSMCCGAHTATDEHTRCNVCQRIETPTAAVPELSISSAGRPAMGLTHFSVSVIWKTGVLGMSSTDHVHHTRSPVSAYTRSVGQNATLNTLRNAR